MFLLRLGDVSREFAGTVPVRALDHVSLEIAPGEFFAIVGASGGGKSTLLNTIGLLDRPSSGSYEISGEDVTRSTPTRLAQIRSETFGFIFQRFHLLDQRPVLDSVELGLLYRAVPREERRLRSRRALEHVGLEQLADQKASKLSGGQRQRVAIARALAAGAPVVIADEPTGNLDSVNGQRVLDTLLRLRNNGTTIVLVTHDPEIAAKADRIGHIRDGRIDRIETTQARVPQSHATPAPIANRVPHESPSRLRTLDVFRDAFSVVTSRAGRTAGLVGAVATAVALAVTTIGISVSASAQVSDRFDLHTNRDVSVTWQAPANDQPTAVTGSPPTTDSASMIRRLDSLAGVTAAGLLGDRGSATVEAAPGRDALRAPTAAITNGVVSAARLKITWAPHHPHRLAAGDVLVGRNLATQIPLGQIDAGPRLSIGASNHEVAGIITGSPRIPSLLGSIVTPYNGFAGLEAANRTTAILRTGPGAAQQVAKQAPYAVDPVHLDQLTVDAPTDPTSLRAEVQGDVQSTLLAFTAVALLAAIVGLANAMILAVLERRQEFGLRRAIGARPAHISALVLTESGIIGALGGVAGLALGLGAVLVITVVRQWIPVFDIRLAPAALLGGVLVGAFGGLAAAFRASRIEPSEALRL